MVVAESQIVICDGETGCIVRRKTDGGVRWRGTDALSDVSVGRDLQDHEIYSSLHFIASAHQPDWRVGNSVKGGEGGRKFRLPWRRGWSAAGPPVIGWECAAYILHSMEMNCKKERGSVSTPGVLVFFSIVCGSSVVAFHSRFKGRKSRTNPRVAPLRLSKCIRISCLLSLADENSWETHEHHSYSWATQEFNCKSELNFL